MISSTNLSLVEFPNLKSLKNIWKHPLIHESQKLNIKKYCDACIDGKVNVEYFMKYDFGRLQLKDATVFSSVAQWNAVRSTLFADTEYDIDIVGCHQNILLGICKGVVVCENLEYYCNNRSLIIDSIHIADIAITKFNELNQDNKTKKDFVKSLFTIIMYGGNIATWEKEFGITDDDYKLTPFVNDFIDEILMLADVVINLPQYKPIKTQVFKKEKTKRIRQIDYENANKKDKRKKDNVFDVDKFHVKSCKTLSIILQDIERLIILDAFAFLQVLHKVTITSYNYDGFQVLKSTFDTDLIPLLNKEIAKKWKYIEFIVKPFSPQLDMSVIPDELPVLTSVDFHFIDDYSFKKQYFEKFVSHIQNPSMFVVKDVNGDIISLMKENILCSAYKHFGYTIETVIGKKITSFISAWLADEEKLSFTKLVYEPPPLKPPSYFYNSWNGWKIDKTKYKKADTKIIYNHIRTMAGLSNTEEVYEYLLNWLAWCVKYPSMKTMVCLILYGSQRVGKSCLAENIMTKIMGKEKLMITGNIDKIFGKHSNLTGKHIVVLNEANGKETKGIHELIKDSISREVCQLELKGVDAVEVNDYANYILTTNNISSVDVPKGDSRFMPIHVGESLLGNHDYFIKLRSALDNDDVMGTFRDELLERDLIGWNACGNRPMTDLKKDMLEMSVSPYEEFLNWVYETCNEEFEKDELVKRSGGELYSMFKTFWAEVGRFGQPSSSTKFGVEFKQLKEVKCVRSSCGVKFTISKSAV